jgi:hypothetical protein
MKTLANNPGAIVCLILLCALAGVCTAASPIGIGFVVAAALLLVLLIAAAMGTSE